MAQAPVSLQIFIPLSEGNPLCLPSHLLLVTETSTVKFLPLQLKGLFCPRALVYFATHIVPLGPHLPNLSSALAEHPPLLLHTPSHLPSVTTDFLHYTPSTQTLLLHLEKKGKKNSSCPWPLPVGGQPGSLLHP